MYHHSNSAFSVAESEERQYDKIRYFRLGLSSCEVKFASDQFEFILRINVRQIFVNLRYIHRMPTKMLSIPIHFKRAKSTAMNVVFNNKSVFKGHTLDILKKVLLILHLCLIMIAANYRNILLINYRICIAKAINRRNAY